MMKRNREVMIRNEIKLIKNKMESKATLAVKWTESSIPSFVHIELFFSVDF